MSAIVRTPECFPENDRFLGGAWMGELNTPAITNHEACPGGFTMPGVLGGWHCPCDCHRKATAS